MLLQSTKKVLYGILEFDFPFLQQLVNELSYCADMHSIGLMYFQSEEKQRYIRLGKLKSDIFLNEERVMHGVRTSNELPDCFDGFACSDVSEAFYMYDWKRIVTTLGLEMVLPSEVTCIEHFLRKPIQLINPIGQDSQSLIGFTVLCRQETKEAKNAILVDVVSMVRSDKKPDEIKFLYSSTTYMMTCIDDPIVYVRDLDDNDPRWRKFESNTVENIAFAQIVTLLINKQYDKAFNADVLYEF